MGADGRASCRKPQTDLLHVGRTSGRIPTVLALRGVRVGTRKVLQPTTDRHAQHYHRATRPPAVSPFLRGDNTRPGLDQMSMHIFFSVGEPSGDLHASKLI